MTTAYQDMAPDGTLAQQQLLFTGTRAAGTLQCLAAADITTGHTDGPIGGKTLKYWKTAITPSGGSIIDLDISGATTAQDVAVIVRAGLIAASCPVTAGVPVAGLIPLTETRYGQDYNIAMLGTAASVRTGMLGGRNPLTTTQGMRLLQKVTVVDTISGYSFKVNPSEFSHLHITGVGPFSAGWSALLKTDGANGAHEMWTASAGSVTPAVHNDYFDIGVYGGNNGARFNIDMVYDGKSLWSVFSNANTPTYALPFSRQSMGQLPQGTSSVDIVAYNGTGMTAGAVLQIFGM